MKSAEEYASEYAKAGASDKPRVFCEVIDCSCSMNECKEIADYVRAIQADAIKACADIIKTQADGRIDEAKDLSEVPMKSATMKGILGGLFVENMSAHQKILSLLPKD